MGALEAEGSSGASFKTTISAAHWTYAKKINLFKKKRIYPNPKSKSIFSFIKATKLVSSKQHYTFAKPPWAKTKQAVFNSSTDFTDSDLINTNIIQRTYNKTRTLI